MAEKLKASAYEYKGLAFASIKDTPLDAQNIVNRYVKLLLKRTGPPYIR